MAWPTIAKKDFREATDAKLVVYLAAVVVLAFVGGGYVLPLSVQRPSTADFPGQMLSAVGTLVPLLGILLGYDAIASERESGQLALLLSLPHSRRDAIVGKLAGRALVLAIAVGLGVVLGGALVVYPFGSLDAVGLGWYLALTTLYGIAFVAIGMALSAAAGTRQVATAAAFGVFFAFAVVWPQIRGLLVLGLEWLGLADGRLPGWALFVYGAEPGMLYERIVRASFDVSGPSSVPSADAAWYTNEWIALVLLVGWVVGPVGAGYLEFRRTDL